MSKRQSAALDRKKFFGDPVMVITIIVLSIFLALFILYPLSMLLVDSVLIKGNDLYSVADYAGNADPVFYTGDGAVASQDQDQIFALLRSPDGSLPDQYAPLYRSTGFFAAKAQLRDTRGGAKVYLKVVNSQDKTAYVALDELDKVANVPLTYLPNNRLIRDMTGVDPAALCVHIDASVWTLDTFPRIFSDYIFNNALKNTLLLGALTGIFSLLIGLLFAYVDVYVHIRSRFSKKLFDVVSMLPVVSPPFVLSLSMILLFGRGGLITRKLLGIYDSDVYGMWGIVIVQTLTFFPVVYLMLKGLLKNIDPSMEEAARDMGASRWKVFMTVTLPLMLPGLGNAFLVTFIESVADFANPMIIGGSYDTLATTIYLRITGGTYDINGASAMAVVLLFLTLFMFMIQKFVLEKKTAATLSGKASRARMLIEDKSVRYPLTVLCMTISLFVVLMYIAVPFGALFKLWGRDYSLSTRWFEQMFHEGGWKAFQDSFLLSIIASPVTALLSMIISYLVVKRKFHGKGLIEFVSMLAMAVPGTVLGVGFIRGFSGGIFRTGFLQSIYGSGLILVIVFVVRSLPVGTRSGISALRQIDKSIEESAYDMGAGSGKVFMTVTLPLIKDSFFSGLVTTFVRSITAISAVILLVTPRFLLITCRINEYAEKGEFGVACAYATILIAITYTAIVIMNVVLKYFGTSRNAKPKKERKARKGVSSNAESE